jgi:tRNA dimethylallyltransferase
VPRPRLLCVTGHTASGKSSLAMALAERLGAELLSVDSMQVWRGFDAGTAKPTAEEQARVRHHGIDLVDPADHYSAGAFLRYARGVIADAEQRSVPLIAVGGTGLYLKAMLHGLAPAPPADMELRAKLRASEAERPGTLHERLTGIDPVAAARVHPNDGVRLERAIEVFELTGKTMTDWHAEHRFPEPPFTTWLLGIRRPRPELHARIAARVRVMLGSGWVDEVRGLLAAGVSDDAIPMKAIGYPEVAAHVRGRLGLAAAEERIVVATRRFAKRQATWFNREPSVEWVDPTDDLADRLTPRVAAFLAGGDP